MKIINRRSFFSVIAGAIGGVYAAFVPKAKGLTVADLLKCRDELKKAKVTWVAPVEGVPRRKGMKFPLENLDKTLNWIFVGPYKKLHYVIQMDCCYTHKNGKKMRCAVLFDKDNFQKVFKNTDVVIRRRAIEGGAWYPTKEIKHAKKKES